MLVYASEPGARQYRVLLDGVDVTDRCYLAQEEEGIVGLYKRNEQGAFYAIEIPGGRKVAAWETLYGKVEIVPRTREWC